MVEPVAPPAEPPVGRGLNRCGGIEDILARVAGIEPVVAVSKTAVRTFRLNPTPIVWLA